MYKEFIDGEEYRLVTVRGRSKLISKEGKAINPIRRKQKATTHLNSDGYLCFGGSAPVHLYVAHGWVDGYFEGAEVNHKDFNRLNNCADNLEWVTHSDNIKHSVKNNSEVWNAGKSGIHNGRATFTEEEVYRIREMYDEGMSIADIVRIFYPDLKHASDYKNIHSTFSSICRRKTWKHLA